MPMKDETFENGFKVQPFENAPFLVSLLWTSENGEEATLVHYRFHRFFGRLNVDGRQ